jgi:hypothetical protein
VSAQTHGPVWADARPTNADARSLFLLNFFFPSTGTRECVRADGKKENEKIPSARTLVPFARTREKKKIFYFILFYFILFSVLRTFECIHASARTHLRTYIFSLGMEMQTGGGSSVQTEAFLWPNFQPPIFGKITIGFGHFFLWIGI